MGTFFKASAAYCDSDVLVWVFFPPIPLTGLNTTNVNKSHSMTSVLFFFLFSFVPRVGKHCIFIKKKRRKKEQKLESVIIAFNYCRTVVTASSVSIPCKHQNMANSLSLAPSLPLALSISLSTPMKPLLNDAFKFRIRPRCWVTFFSCFLFHFPSNSNCTNVFHEVQTCFDPSR